MLPAKIGEGVLGSKVGGVKPVGASFVSAALPSAAAALMVNRDDDFEDNERLDDDDDDFRETSPEAREDGANSEAWVAIAIFVWSLFMDHWLWRNNSDDNWYFKPKWFPYVMWIVWFMGLGIRW